MLAGDQQQVAEAAVDQPAGLGLDLVDDPLAARWLLRVVVSLLMVPGADEAEERALVERFVAPLVSGPSRAAGIQGA